MWQTRPRRTRRDVEHELAKAVAHRDQATRHLDFEAYQYLSEHVDDLLEELAQLLPAQRGAGE